MKEPEVIKQYPLVADYNRVEELFGQMPFPFGVDYTSSYALRLDEEGRSILFAVPEQCRGAIHIPLVLAWFKWPHTVDAIAINFLEGLAILFDWAENAPIGYLQHLAEEKRFCTILCTEPRLAQLLDTLNERLRVARIKCLEDIFNAS